MEREHEERAFDTLRGALTGDEPDEPIYFAHSASLRICGIGRRNRLRKD